MTPGVATPYPVHPALPPYRTLVEETFTGDSTQPMTRNDWVAPAAEPNVDGDVEPFVHTGDPYPWFWDRYSDADARSLWWSQPLVEDYLPTRRLWTPPLANQREPRMYAKLNTANDESTIDTAIGSEFGLVRWAPCNRPYEGIQIDGMAAVFTRFNDRRLLVTSDFRAGVPITYAKGPWQAKISYEHTSTHVGDEYAESTGRRQTPHVRDEIVFGLSRHFTEELRLYGQVGYSFVTSDVVGEDRMRYDWGVEWATLRPTGRWGKPFGAFDMDLRSDQDFQPNITAQLGWMWRRRVAGRTARIAAELYNGKSPYGQFFQDDEDWFGLSAFYDF